MNISIAPDTSWVAPPKLYRIGEVVRYSGFSRQTIHNYTTMGLIREQERTAGGHRMYGEDVFRTLAVIRSLKGKKTSLDEIRHVLESRGLIETSGAASVGDSASAAADGGI